LPQVHEHVELEVHDLVDPFFEIIHWDELYIFRSEKPGIGPGKRRCIVHDADLVQVLGLAGKHEGKSEHQEKGKQDVPAQGGLVANEFHVPGVQYGEKFFHGILRKLQNILSQDGHG
jgi:hypothetical protein